MGSLIQTKGTQRLAKLFNDRFDAGSIGTTGGLVKAAFNDVSQDLLSISDSFIAANAVAGWPTTGTTAGDDLLYPAATMRPRTPG